MHIDDQVEDEVWNQIWDTIETDCWNQIHVRISIHMDVLGEQVQNQVPHLLQEQFEQNHEH